MMLPPPGLLDCSKERHALYDISKTEILCTALDLQKKSKEAKQSKIWFKYCINHKSWNTQVSKLMSEKQYDRGM